MKTIKNKIEFSPKTIKNKLNFLFRDISIPVEIYASINASAIYTPSDDSELWNFALYPGAYSQLLYEVTQRYKVFCVFVIGKNYN